MVYNPVMKLVSPQYHVVHDESFDTVQINMSTADAECKLEEMLDALFITSEWAHSDAYSDDTDPHTIHHYFDSSWDLAQTMIQATCPHKCTCNCSQEEVPLSKGVSDNSDHVSVPQHIDSTVERNGHSDSSVTSTPVPSYEGAVISDDILEIDTQTQPGLLTSHLHQPDDNADLMTQHNTIFEASPSSVPARTPT